MTLYEYRRIGLTIALFNPCLSSMYVRSCITGGGGGGGAYEMWPRFWSPFQLKFLNRIEEFVRNSEPGRIWQKFSFQMAFLANLCLISFFKGNFWLSQFIFNNKFSYETVEIDQIMHNIMSFGLATLPKWRMFSQTRPKRTPK